MKNSVDPFELFRTTMNRAVSAGIVEPSAMNLATVGVNGRPSSRMVLLKGFDREGFVFYTNLSSRKGRELATNPFAALCFFWQSIGSQVRIEGEVRLVGDDEADRYFATRERGSQIGAWASRQSEELQSTDELLREVAAIESRYQGAEIPRPPFWSGYRLVPDRFEFWTAGPNRLHERLVVIRRDGEWETHNIFP